MNPSDKYEQIKDIKHLNPVELEAMVLHHEQQIKDIAAHLLELKQQVTPMMEFKRSEWVGLTVHDQNDCLVSADPCECLADPESHQLMDDVEAKLKDKNGG
jgi:hypothetical protein